MKEKQTNKQANKQRYMKIKQQKTKKVNKMPVTTSEVIYRQNSLSTTFYSYKIIK